MNNDTKTQLQQREFAKLKGHRRVALKWATGCGKSKMAIDLINKAVETFDITPVRVLFLVAERAHIKNWQIEFEKWHLNTSRVATDVYCYASLNKVCHEEYDIVVLDEAHHAFTPKRLWQLQLLSDNLRWGNFVFMLSATLSADKMSTAEEIFSTFTTSSVTLKDAIQSDILPDPRVYVIEMELDNLVADQEIKIGSGNVPEVKWEDRMRYFYNNKPCRIKCTQFQKYVYLTNTMEYWKERYKRSKNPWHQNKWVNTGSVRKRFLGELKTAYVKKLLKSLTDKKRLVCFCASVAQADTLNKKYTISSKRTAKQNQEIIDSFNAKRINRIFAVGMITEGMNLTDIETGIIVQLDGKERLFIQKFGRSMRSEDPVSYIFYFKNTQDEVYLKSALENIDSKYIRYINAVNTNYIEYGKNDY